jgi:AraC family transcriptional regulator of adaptative response / DNA-3-methyladenine glycosylase II
VEVIALRCLADPDAFPAKDLLLARALQNEAGRADAWRPWRAYFTLWLWNQHSEKDDS